MNEVWHARHGIVARRCARGRVRSRRPGFGGGAWQRLEALPDPRSRRGRIYPLACLVAVAVCAFTAARNDRFTSVRQWIRRASQADLARLRAPWDPLAGRYRVPDEKTIRVVLNQLDRRALARALLGPRGRRPGGPSSASVRSYPARRRRRAGQSAGARPVKGSGRGRQDFAGSPAAPMAPESISSASLNMAGVCWTILKSASSTTRPAPGHAERQLNPRGNCQRTAPDSRRRHGT